MLPHIQSILSEKINKIISFADWSEEIYSLRYQERKEFAYHFSSWMLVWGIHWFDRNDDTASWNQQIVPAVLK